MMSGVPYELRIGRRYLRSTGNRFLSFISLMSMLGVAIGVAVLIVVLSVMNGFERELRTRILSRIAVVRPQAPDPTISTGTCGVSSGMVDDRTTEGELLEADACMFMMAF